MNKLTCNHEFDMNAALLSNPIQYRCKHCRVTAFEEEVLAYNAELAKSAKLNETSSEFAELWKDIAVASIRGGNRVNSAGSFLIETAIKAADDVVSAYRTRKF